MCPPDDASLTALDTRIGSIAAHGEDAAAFRRQDDGEAGPVASLRVSPSTFDTFTLVAAAPATPVSSVPASASDRSPIASPVAPLLGSVLIASPTTPEPVSLSPAAMPEPNDSGPAPSHDATPAPANQPALADADGIRPMTLAPTPSSAAGGDGGGTATASASPVAGGGVLAYTMSSGGSGGYQWDDKGSDPESLGRKLQHGPEDGSVRRSDRGAI